MAVRQVRGRAGASGGRAVSAAVAPLLVLTARALDDLAEELGGPEASAGWLAELAQGVGRPIGVNLPTGADTGSTAFIAPRSWSQERLRGWIGARHAELGLELGMAARVGPFPAPGGVHDWAAGGLPPPL